MLCPSAAGELARRTHLHLQHLAIGLELPTDPRRSAILRAPVEPPTGPRKVPHTVESFSTG
eukprot:369740-Pelagomonas_calceolata.AAC.1